MKKFFLFAAVAMLAAPCVMAQDDDTTEAPELATKGVLPTTLLSSPKTFSELGEMTETLEAPGMDTNYTLEFNAEVTEGDGLRFMASNANGYGFHGYLATDGLYFGDLEDDWLLADDNKGTFRFAVEGSSVYVYVNGEYVTYGDCSGNRTIEATDTKVTLTGFDPTPASAKTGNDNCTDLMAHGFNVWNASGSDGVYEYTNIDDSFSNRSRYQEFPFGDQEVLLNGAAYNGMGAMLVWDSEGGKTNVWTLKLPGLEANKTYVVKALSCIYNNLNASQGFWTQEAGMILGVSNTADPAGTFATQYNDVENHNLGEVSVGFTTSEAGDYYLVIKPTWAMFVFTQFEVVEGTPLKPVVEFQKDFDGGATMILNSVTFDAEGAFAPGSTEGVAQTLVENNAAAVAYTIDGRRVNANNLQNGLYIVNGKKVIIRK